MKIIIYETKTAVNISNLSECIYFLIASNENWRILHELSLPNAKVSNWAVWMAY